MNYTYDANGRQITAAGTDEIGTQTSVYDCGGQRVQTAGNNITRQMVYDIFGQLVAATKMVPGARKHPSRWDSAGGL